MERIPVESSIIHSIGYDEDLQVLQIESREGHVRDYKNVPRHLYRQFITAESKGKFYLKYIRKKFPYTE